LALRGGLGGPLPLRLFGLPVVIERLAAVFVRLGLPSLQGRVKTRRTGGRVWLETRGGGSATAVADAYRRRRRGRKWVCPKGVLTGGKLSGIVRTLVADQCHPPSKPPLFLHNKARFHSRPWGGRPPSPAARTPIFTCAGVSRSTCAPRWVLWSHSSPKHLQIRSTGAKVGRW
jgi:hypothetical protein